MATAIETYLFGLAEQQLKHSDRRTNHGAAMVHDGVDRALSGSCDADSMHEIFKIAQDNPKLAAFAGWRASCKLLRCTMS